MKKRFPWKQSFRDMPPSISAELKRIKSDIVIVAATKKIAVSDIRAGLYDHLGLHHDGDKTSVVANIVPQSTTGKYSDRNVNGYVIKRTDLPKIIKTFSWETPNFGDASTYGTHIHYQDREVYQQQAFEPRKYQIKMEILNDPTIDTVLIKFEVDQLLDRSATRLNDEIFFCLNLLQENVGVSGVFPSNATREDFLGTVRLDWEIFPPGHAAQLIASLSRGRVNLTPAQKGSIESRLKLFEKFPVKKLIKGSNNFGSYVGALYFDDLVVFENMSYGNALYVLYDNWEDISKRSRLELLRGTTKDYDRFVHAEGWEDRFKEHIKAEIKKRAHRH